MSISKFSIEQPVFVNLFMVLIIIAGLFAFNSISKEEFPEISLNAVSITTIYPGVSPEEIEALITKPIEEEVSDIDDIDNNNRRAYAAGTQRSAVVATLSGDNIRSCRGDHHVLIRGSRPVCFIDPQAGR